jgi:hypothetical protein
MSRRSQMYKLVDCWFGASSIILEIVLNDLTGHFMIYSLYFFSIAVFLYVLGWGQSYCGTVQRLICTRAWNGPERNKYSPLV